MNIKFNVKDKIKSKDILDKTIISFLSWDSDGKAFHLWERLLVISYIHVLFFFLGTEKSILNNGLWAKIMTIFRPVPLKLHLNREDNKELKEREPQDGRPGSLNDYMDHNPSSPPRSSPLMQTYIKLWVTDKLLLPNATGIVCDQR